MVYEKQTKDMPGVPFRGSNQIEEVPGAGRSGVRQGPRF